MKKRTVITTEKHEVWVIRGGVERPAGPDAFADVEEAGAAPPPPAAPPAAETPGRTPAEERGADENG